MTASNFRDPKAGRIVRTLTGHDAFVPAAPPPELHYDPQMVLRLSQADAALGRLAGLAERMPNPTLMGLLADQYAHREAVLSSRIEGTRAGLSDVLMAEAGEPAADSPADVREVRNYREALRLGAARLSEGAPLGLPLVREIHAALMDGLPHASPGAFRDTQVWIGRAGSGIAGATYVPPPPVHLAQCLQEWETFVQQRDQLPDLVQCALMHEHFEAVHPFADGNGRVGRLLITLFLIDRGRLTQPMLYLSDYFERHRADYYDLLMRARTDGDWADWLRFFLAGVKETADAAIARAAAILDLRESYTWLFERKYDALALVDHLFENPYTTIARVAQALRLSTPTARKLVAQFEQRGILRNMPESRWGKLYVAPEILSVLGDPE